MQDHGLLLDRRELLALALGGACLIVVASLPVDADEAPASRQAEALWFELSGRAGECSGHDWPDNRPLGTIL